MSFDISLQIPNNSPEAILVETVMASEHITAQEAILKILRNSAPPPNAALAGLGLFSKPEDAKLLDDVVAQAYEERRQPSRSIAQS